MILVALLAAVALAWFLGRRAKMALEVIAALAVAGIMIFVVSKIPGSPTACLHTADSCRHGTTAFMVCVVILPLAVMAVIDHLRGRPDRR